MKSKRARLILVGLFILCGTAFAFAFQTGAAPAAPAAGNGGPQLPIKLGGGVLAGILSGIIGAVGTVGAGILKSKDPKTGVQEPVDISKAWETFLVGAVIGGAAGWFKLAPADVVTYLTTSPIGMGLVAWSEMAWNAVFRQTAGIVMKTIALFKTGTDAPKA